MVLHSRTVAIGEPEQLTQHKSKTADRGLRLHRLVLALRRARARAQLRGARARNTLTRYSSLFINPAIPSTDLYG